MVYFNVKTLKSSTSLPVLLCKGGAKVSEHPVDQLAVAHATADFVGQPKVAKNQPVLLLPDGSS